MATKLDLAEVKADLIRWVVAAGFLQNYPYRCTAFKADKVSLENMNYPAASYGHMLRSSSIVVQLSEIMLEKIFFYPISLSRRAEAVSYYSYRQAI